MDKTLHPLPKIFSKRSARIVLIWVWVFFLCGSAHAELARNVHHSLEASAMGGAYTAIVEDESAVFMNPAGVAAYDAMEIRWLSFDITASDDLISSAKTMSKLNKIDGTTINSIMGKNMFIDTGARFMLMSPNFGFASFYNIQLGAFAKNQALPNIELAQEQTAGFQTAFGISSAMSKKRGKGKRNKEFVSEWRFGVAPKYIFRRGGIRELASANLITLDSAQINNLFGNVGSAYGADVGVQRVEKLGNGTTLHFGAAWLDVGDTHFNSNADPIKSKLNVGAGATWGTDKSPTRITLSTELSQLNNTADFDKRTHLGVKLDLPILDIYAGLSQLNLTYGFALDFWFLRISAASYAEELGPIQGQNPDRRYGIRFDFKFRF